MGMIGNYPTLGAVTPDQLQLSSLVANAIAFLGADKKLTATAALTFDGANLGLGTASPSGASGTTFAINGGAGQTRLALKNNNSGDASSDGFQIALLSDGVNVVYQNRESGYQSWELAGSEQMRLTSTGLGIGTSSPSTALDVASASGSPIISLTASGAWRYQILTDRSTKTFRIRDQSAGDLDRVILDSSGNLGLGVTPTSGYGALQVLATGSVFAGGMQRAIEIYDQGSGGSEGGAITFSSATCPAFAAIWGQSANPGGSLVFGTNSANTGYPLERARIDSSGNFLVGTTSKLAGGVSGIDINHVTTPGITMGIGASQKAFLYAYSVTSRMQGETASGYTIAFVSGGSNGVSLANGGTSWGALSDERKKDIIEPITGASGKVASLRAVIGKYKTDDDGARRSFLIAQDVQAVLPEAVTEDVSGDLILQYTDTIPLLVAAIQEQQALITSLTARITALEN